MAMSMFSSVLRTIPLGGAGFGSTNRRRNVDMEERRQRRHQRTLGRGPHVIAAAVTVLDRYGIFLACTLQIVPRRSLTGLRSSVAKLPVIRDVVVFLVMGRDDGSDFNRDMATVASTKSASEERTAHPRAQDAGKVELDRTVGPFLELLSRVDEVLDTGRIDVGNSREVENEGTKERL